MASTAALGRGAACEVIPASQMFGRMQKITSSRFYVLTVRSVPQNRAVSISTLSPSMGQARISLATDVRNDSAGHQI